MPLALSCGGVSSTKADCYECVCRHRTSSCSWTRCPSRWQIIYSPSATIVLACDGGFRGTSRTGVGCLRMHAMLMRVRRCNTSCFRRNRNGTYAPKMTALAQFGPHHDPFLCSLHLLRDKTLSALPPVGRSTALYGYDYMTGLGCSQPGCKHLSFAERAAMHCACPSCPKRL